MTTIVIDIKRPITMNCYLENAYSSGLHLLFLQNVPGAKVRIIWVFFSSRSIKRRKKYISFARLVLLSLYVF